MPIVGQLSKSEICSPAYEDYGIAENSKKSRIENAGYIGSAMLEKLVGSGASGVILDDLRRE